jgi:hypothetical protein
MGENSPSPVTLLPRYSSAGIIFIRWRLLYLVLSENYLGSCSSVENIRASGSSRIQCCQMVYLQTNNPTLVKFWGVVQWNMLVYFMAIWAILLSFGIFCGHLVYLMVTWYSFSCFGILYQEKSGNPARDSTSTLVTRDSGTYTTRELKTAVDTVAPRAYIFS